MNLENKAPEEEKDKDKKPVEETADKPDTKTAEQPAPDDKQADENGEGAAAQPEQAEPPTEEAPAEETASETEAKAETAPDPAAELETLREENARLKAQLEAHKAGFKGEYIEDAVLIAEHGAKRDGTTIEEALQAVAKKYPEWKHTAGEGGKSGFKVGAEPPKEENNAVDDKLDEAFGIRKKK
jgi:hypothetical protein